MAVEPLAGMRAELVRVAQAVESHAGTAEAIPLPDSSADAVVVAQAFHWFDGEAALPEAEEAEVLERVRDVFAGLPAPFPAPYRTELWWCRAR